MVMILYGENTPNVVRSILPLFEAEVDVEKELKLVMVSLSTGKHYEPIYTNIQPFSAIPAFEDGDLKLFESRAIAKYLVEKYGGQDSPLLGKTLKERAIINQWMEIEGQIFAPTTGPVLVETFVASMFNRPVNEEIVKAGLAKIGKVLDVYEAHLANGTKYLASDDFSLADAFHSPYMNWCKSTFPELLEDRPHVLAWIDLITTRPAFQKSLQLDWANAPVLQ